MNYPLHYSGNEIQDREEHFHQLENEGPGTESSPECVSY